MKHRPYRVLHVIDSLDLGGAQVVLLNLIKYANRERFHLEAVCLHGRGVFWNRLRESGVPLYSLSFHHWFPSYLPGLAGLMLSRRYDVVHCHLLASNVLAKPLAAACNIRVRINHDHCNDKLADPRSWALPADRWSNRFSTHVVAVSESTRAFVEAHENVPATRTATVHNGIDCEAFRPRPEKQAEARRLLQIPEDAYVIGGIGRLTHQKNFGLFLDVAAKVLAQHSEAFFVIAGTGEEEAALRAQAASIGIEPRLKFAGYVPDMASIYPALDLLLLTSRYEGLPITILEAMATGVPIVASRLDGIKEVLTDDRDATLVTPGDAGEFAGSVNELIENPEMARGYAWAALSKVRARYSAQRMTADIEAIYLRHLETGKLLGTVSA